MKIENLPAERPRCAQCDKVIRPWTKDTRENYRDTEGALRSRVTRREFDGNWHAYPHIRRPIFCTLRCALAFAVAAHVAGYRIVKKAR